MKKNAISILLTLAMLFALAVSVSAASSTDPAELNKVNEAAVQMTTDKVFDNSDENGQVTATCPYCGDPATWKPLPAATSRQALKGHYYLAADQLGNTNYYMAYGGNLCLHLNGHAIKSSNAYAIAGGAGLELNIMGSGSVEGAGSNAYGTVFGQGTVRLFGGSYTATSSNGFVVTTAAENANVYVLDGATITGNAGATSAIAVTKAANCYLYGGTVSGGSSVLYLTKGTVYLAGADIDASNSTKGVSLPANGSATVYHSAGTVSGASICNVDVRTGNYTLSGTGAITGGVTTEEFNSGNVLISGTGVFTMTGGEITDGSGVKGGNVHVYKSSFIMEGGTISGGEASTAGGNIYIHQGSFTQSGGTVSGGEAPNGGSIYNYTGTLSLDGGTVSGGTADVGGNVYLSAGTLTLNGGTVTKGTANKEGNANQWYYNGGGNIYVGDSAAAKAYIKSGTVSDGTASSSGGNILCRGKGTLTISGGTVSGGKAGYPGGNIMNGASANVTISGGTITGGEGNQGGSQANEGDNIVSFGGTLTLSGGKVTSNTSSLGNGVLGYYNAKIILDGAVTVTNIYLANNTSKDATLQVNKTFTGTAGVNFHANHGIAVGKILELDSSTGPFTGKVYVENVSNITLYGTEDNKLQVAATLANNTWYQNNEAAMAAIDGDATIKLYTSDALNLKGANYTVDLAGNSPVITGSGNVTCIDSANKTFKNFGTVTLDGPTLVNTESINHDGTLYYTISDGNKHSFHILEARVSSVSVRPSSAGVYYSCTWNCDSALVELLDVQAYGIALSVDAWPTESFEEDGHTLSTKVEGEFEPGVKGNSVLVDNILKTEDSGNQTRAKRDIFAVPYVVINGKTLVGTGVNYSLKDIVTLMDRWENYLENRVALENFYNTWISVMESWNFTNIGKVSLDPTEDDTLRILMVGNSYCFYFAEELYSLLAENKPDGINKVEVYNLYRGGCTLQEHYERWTGVQDPNYHLWKTDSTGRKLQGGGYTTTLEDALTLANWDYISIQEGLSKFWFPTQEEILAECQQYAEPIIDRIRHIHPNATLLWHQTWAQEIGFSQTRYGQTYTVEDAADQTAYEAKERYVAEQMCEIYDMVRVNTGEAWTEARKNELITNLCARLEVHNFPEGAQNSGDGFHDGDIGGGQMLNAYVWYMVLTGDTTVTDSKFRPRYPLSEDVIAVLQAAAEAAIAAR